MFAVMTWNVENFFAPAPADQSAYNVKLAEVADVVRAVAPDLLAVQEIGDVESFEALRSELEWTGVLSTHFETPHTIRVGWLSPGELTDVEEVVDLPAALSPVKVADDGTTMSQLGRGALAVTATTAAGTRVRALTAHLKSKLLSFPAGRFDTSDETERARYGVYALDRRAAEAAALRDWATAALGGDWADEALLVCGDLNDTPDAATTQLIYGPPGSQIGTGGFSHHDHGDAQRLWDVGYAMVGHLISAATGPLDVPSVGVQPHVVPRTNPPSDHRPVLATFEL